MKYFIPEPLRVLNCNAPEPEEGYAMLDGKLHTATEYDDLEFEIDVNRLTGVYLSNVSCLEVEWSVRMGDTVLASDRVQMLTGARNFEEYVRGRFKRRSRLFISLPFTVAGSRLMIRLRGTNAHLGFLAAGYAEHLGITLSAPEKGILDFSTVIRDEVSGEVYTEQGAYVPTASFSAVVDTPIFEEVEAILASLRAKPVVWIGEGSIPSLTVYGIFKTWRLVYSNRVKSDLKIELEGMI